MRALVTLLPLCHILLSCCASAIPSWEPTLTYQIPPPERIAELAQPYLINPQNYSKTVYYRHGPRDDVSSYVMYAFQSMTDTTKWASAVVRHTYGHHPKNDSNFEPTTTDIALSLEHMVPNLKPEEEGQASEVEFVKNRNFYQKVFLWNQPRSAVLGLEEKLQLGTLIELSQIDRTTQPVLREYSEDMAQELGEGCPVSDAMFERHMRGAQTYQ